MRRKPTAVDLFSGCGGCTSGLKRAGFEVLGAVELDDVASSVYRLNHPEVWIWNSDIALLSGEELIRSVHLDVGELDLLAGCPPCQGFSTVRTLNGSRPARDSRNDLIWEFDRLISSLLPKTVMLENVPGLSTDWRMQRFVQALEGRDYKVTYRVLDAAEYGVPQRRRRLIMLASRLGAVSLARPTGRRRTVRDAIGALARAGSSGDWIHDLPEKRSPTIASLIRKIPTNGGSRTDLPDEMQLACHKRCDGFKDIYGRMAWDEVAPTLTTGCFNPSKGRFLHPREHRAITMREAALLQTFPRSYRFPQGIGKLRLAALIGNALPPEFVFRHARKLRAHILKETKR